LNDRLEPDRFEVPLLLRLSKWILEDDVSVQLLSILPKWRCRKLQDSAPAEALFECSPGGRFDVMCFVDKEVRAVLRYPLLDPLLALTGDAARSHDHVRTLEDLVDFLDPRWDMV